MTPQSRAAKNDADTQMSHDVEILFDNPGEMVDQTVTLYPIIQPKQDLYLRCTAKYHLIGGAKGGGKSYAFRVKAVWSCLIRPNVKGLVLRRSLGEAERNFIDPIRSELPSNLYHYDAQKHRLTFYNGSYIDIGYCESYGDIFRYQGLEYDFVGIEELTQWTEREFRLITNVLRTTKQGIRPFFFGTTNPGGIGHAWVKRLFIDRKFNKNERADDYEIVRATVYDNPILLENDKEYIPNLEALGETYRRAYLEGDWNVFEGQYFSEWRDEIHTCPPMIPQSPKRRGIAIDYGYGKYACVLWGAIDTQGRVWIYRELYVTHHTFSQLAARIAAMTPKNEQIDFMVCDPAALEKKAEDTGVSLHDEFIRIGRETNCQWLGKVDRAQNPRIEGWNLVRRYLHPFTDPNTNELTAQLKVGKNCSELIRTLPEMIHDKRNVEDLDTTLEDHPPDTLRYLLMEFGINILSLKDIAPLNRIMERSWKPDEEEEKPMSAQTENYKGDPEFWKPNHRDDIGGAGEDILTTDF